MRGRRTTILHLLAEVSTKYGTFEKTFVELAQRFTPRGYRLVLQYDRPPNSPLYLRDLYAAGGRIVVAPLSGHQLVGAVRALHLVTRFKPDIVHMHYTGLVTRLLMGLLGHLLGVRRMVSSARVMPVMKHKILWPLSYSLLDRTLCSSRAVERAMSDVGVSPDRLFTLYPGVPEAPSLRPGVRDEVRARHSIPTEAPVVVTIGFDSPMKGIDVLVEAFADHLVGEFPAVHLMIVGVGVENRLDVTPRADAVPSRIHWVGIHDDVCPYLAAADVYVQPSRTEAFGVAIVEAMRQSLPVVATRVGGIPEVVLDGETGLLVSPESPGELAAAISRLLLDRELADSFARSGHARWRAMFEFQPSLEALIREHYGVSDPASAGGHRP